jgi:putative Mg2+ transporter-C (MgtC) family protein
MIGRLLVALAAAALIGLERETAQKAAGLRTHTLVGVGAAMFTIAGIVAFETVDQSRIAAQVVTGIGFLGAGAIFREGPLVQGLTTAAGLWVAAAIGVAAGAGEIVLAVVGASLALVVLYGIRIVDEAIERRQARAKNRVEVTLDDPRKLEALLEFARRIDPGATQVGFRRGEATAVLTISVDPDRCEMIAEMLAAHKGVAEVEVLPGLHASSGDRPAPGGTGGGG